MSKFCIGELVRFREAEINVSAIPSLCVKLKTEHLSGKVTGIIDGGPEETKYYVDIKMPVKDWVINVKVKESQIMTTSEYASKVIDDIMKKVDVSHTFNPLLTTDARFINPFFCVDLGVAGGDKSAVSVVDKKMSKSRCVKLLESYRAEREKVKKGRKFERCLRDSVVDDALERAIELLKGGTE